MAGLIGLLALAAVRADGPFSSPGTNAPAKTAPDTTRYEVWITGEVFERGGVLLFRADKPVQGNSEGNVVLLGATTQTVKVLLPMYSKAAEKHVPLRLYGILLPAPAGTKVHSGPTPSVVFITWKLHLPSDPDVLPPGKAIPINSSSTVTFTNADGTPSDPFTVRINPAPKGQ